MVFSCVMSPQSMLHIHVIHIHTQHTHTHTHTDTETHRKKTVTQLWIFTQTPGWQGSMQFGDCLCARVRETDNMYMCVSVFIPVHHCKSLWQTKPVYASVHFFDCKNDSFCCVFLHTCNCVKHNFKHSINTSSVKITSHWRGNTPMQTTDRRNSHTAHTTTHSSHGYTPLYSTPLRSPCCWCSRVW